MTSQTSSVAVDIASNKELTLKLLSAAGIYALMSFTVASAHIDFRATRAAWQLDEIDTEYSAIAATQPAAGRADLNLTIPPLRLWDGPHLRDALRALEPPLSHQQLSPVHLDRYDIGGHAKLIGIAAAEAGGAPRTGEPAPPPRPQPFPPRRSSAVGGGGAASVQQAMCLVDVHSA